MAFSDNQLKKSASQLAILVSAVLVVLKIFAWYLTKSISVQASMLDSVLDTLTACLNLLALRYSIRPVDDQHRWGHGKAEALAGFAQAVFMVLFACFLLVSVVHRLFHPSPVNTSLIGMSLIVAGSFITLLLILWQRYVARKTNSLIIQTNLLTYETELLSNFGILLSLYISMKFKFVYVDFIVGVLITVYLLNSVWSILWSSVDILMDKEIDSAITQRIIELVLGHQDVRQIHNMRTRSGGTKRFVQFSIELDGAQPTHVTESIIHDLRAQIHNLFPDMDVTIYPE